jgi:hypothetical protein
MISTHLAPASQSTFTIFPSGDLPSHFTISTATTSQSFASIDNLPGTKISFLIFLSFGNTKPKFPEEV